MPLFQAQCVLPFFTGIPTDVIVNRFHFDSTLPDATAADVIGNRLSTFYNQVYGTGAAARAAYVDWTLAQIKVFDLSEPTPRIPEVRPMTGFIGAGSNASTIPTEVACVLSWHAAPASGVRFQRLYNRVFLGALPTSAIVGAQVDAYPIIAAGFITTLRTAAQNLLDANEDLTRWVQVSNAGGVQVSRTIVGGWIDNSPDTQRRRSVIASSRNPWLPLP